jgi:hypothetical protein
MALPFNSEGKVVIDIDAPSKAQRVADGVEHWLEKSGAQDLLRKADRISFQGASVYSAACKFSPLRGIGESTILIQNSPGKVVLEYKISFFNFPIWLAILLSFPVAAAAGAPSILFCLLLLPVFPAVIYLMLLTKIFAFRGALQIAAIRGLADGAAEELAHLRAKTPNAGVPSAVSA